MTEPNKEVIFPILPHLKKFIIKFYKLEKAPYYIDLHSPVGLVISNVLRSKQLTCRLSAKDKEKYTAHFHCILSKRMSELEIRTSYLIRFNMEFKQIFRDQLCNWVMAQSQVNIPYYKSVELFLVYYDIKESEYSYDAALRMWNRYNASRQKQSRKSG